MSLVIVANRALLALLSLFSALSASALYGRSLNEIIAHKNLIICMPERDHPPFFMFDAKQKAEIGLDIEFAQDMANALGVKLVLLRKGLNYNDLSGILLRDKADLIIASFHVSLDRAKEIQYSIPYFKEPRIFLQLHKGDDSLVNTLINKQKPKSGKPFKTGILAKSSYEKSFQEKYLNSERVIFKQMPELVSALKNGQIDFANISESIINEWLKGHQEDVLYLKKYRYPYEYNQIAVGVNPNNDHLRTWVNTFIETRQNDGTLKRLGEKYFNESEFKTFEIPHVH